VELQEFQNAMALEIGAADNDNRRFHIPELLYKYALASG
jgi:hypothetical protein